MAQSLFGNLYHGTVLAAAFCVSPSKRGAILANLSRDLCGNVAVQRFSNLQNMKLLGPQQEDKYAWSA